MTSSCFELIIRSCHWCWTYCESRGTFVYWMKYSVYNHNAEASYVDSNYILYLQLPRRMQYRITDEPTKSTLWCKCWWYRIRQRGLCEEETHPMFFFLNTFRSTLYIASNSVHLSRIISPIRRALSVKWPHAFGVKISWSLASHGCNLIADSTALYMIGLSYIAGNQTYSAVQYIMGFVAWLSH